MTYYIIAIITKKNNTKEALSFSVDAKSRKLAEKKMMNDILSQCHEGDELSINTLTKLEWEYFIINKVI